jgi:hypothetical protein
MIKITLSGTELVAYRIQVSSLTVIVFDLFLSSNLKLYAEICLALPTIIQHDGHYNNRTRSVCVEPVEVVRG